MKRSILIVGGGGYIGNALIENFKSFKYLITSFDNLIYGQKKVKNTNIKFINGDLRIKADILKVDKVYDTVIFLAGLVGDPITNKYKQTSKIINEDFTKRFIKMFYESGKSRKFIFVSTCSNYGKSKKKFLKENHSLKPLSPYAKSKVKIEKFILNLKKKKTLVQQY